MTLSELNGHRKAGHAGKGITAMVLAAGSGEIGQLARNEIAKKSVRLERLEYLYLRLHKEIEQAKVGELDPRIATAAAMMLQQAAKEMGEWRPDGGEKAEATAQLAQSIVIHAAVSSGKALGYDRAAKQVTLDVSANDSTKSSEPSTTE